MIIVDQLTGVLLVLVSAIIMSIGVYGFTASRNLFRQLLSIEVLFNGVFLLVITLLSASPLVTVYYSIVVISVVSVEAIVVTAILVAFLRAYRTHSSTDLEESEV